MNQKRRSLWSAFAVRSGLPFAALVAIESALLAQEQAPPPRPVPAAETAPLTPLTAPAPQPGDKPLPINLATALQLAGARPYDIALASERIRVAAAQLQQARALWLPTILLGSDYFRHDGQIQAVAGDVFGTSKGAFMLGAGPSAVFAITDAIFAPLAARQVVRAREASLQATRNDTLLSVAEAYFNVQQARGELAGALDATRRAEEVARRAGQLADGGLAPPLEESRARAELARRRQAAAAARERWRTASAELVRLLRLDPSAVVLPLEPPHLAVSLIGLDKPVDDLIPIALTNRPELASQQALVQATLRRLRQERLRPLVPSVLLRGAATNPAPTLSSGYFGGGLNGSLNNFGARNDIDIQVLWELRNLGFGNRGLQNERKAENQLATLELFRLQDFIAAEVARAHAELRSAAERRAEAESGLKDAIDSANKNLEGLAQTKRPGELILLVIRPQEVVAAVQALALAYSDYYGAVADYNRAQFRLYRALGQPAQALAADAAACPAPPPSGGRQPPETPPPSGGRQPPETNSGG